MHKPSTGIPAAMLLAGGIRNRRNVSDVHTPDPDDQIAEIHDSLGLGLVLGRLASDNGVGTYAWVDGHGEVVCCGSVRGSIYQTKCAAVHHLKGSGTSV